MADEPIRSGEFNRAMESIRDGLGILHTGQETLRDDIARLNDLHLKCLQGQNQKSFEAGQAAAKILDLQVDVTGLMNARETGIAQRRSLIAGLLVALVASALSLVMQVFLRK